MFNNNNKVFAALLTLAALLLRDGSGVAAHLNVFLNSEEVMRLLGKFLSPFCLHLLRRAYVFCY